MLREHGTFEALEVMVKKWHKQSLGTNRSGGWYTKHVLASQFHWSKSMINSAWEWARSRNLLRVNPIHKEEEAKLVINDSFELCTETGSEVDMSGNIEAQ
ncbi:unnamed protein product, partial [Symbiodinium sp. CCMP2456]